MANEKQGIISIHDLVLPDNIHVIFLSFCSGVVDVSIYIRRDVTSQMMGDQVIY